MFHSVGGTGHVGWGKNPRGKTGFLPGKASRWRGSRWRPNLAERGFCMLCTGNPKSWQTNPAVVSHLCLPPASGAPVLETSVWHTSHFPQPLARWSRRGGCDVELQMHETVNALPVREWEEYADLDGSAYAIFIIATRHKLIACNVRRILYYFFLLGK